MAEKLTCIPSSGTFPCNDGQTIRVRTSDGKQGVAITALYVRSQIKVVPDSGLTGENGFLEVKVTCEGRCPTETEITFDADKPGYEPAGFKVSCISSTSLAVAERRTIKIDDLPSNVSPSALVLNFMDGVVPGYLRSVAQKVKVLSAIARAFESEAAKGGTEAVTNLTRAIALELQQRRELPLLFGFRIHLFPPSIEFGGDEDTVTVSPTVGGTDNPDARANVGVQIDVNPSGAGRGPVARVTAGVDVDDAGKPKGGVFGFRCRF